VSSRSGKPSNKKSKSRLAALADDDDKLLARPGADDAGRGDRSKRLLDLVMILLGARTPVTYRDIREQFPAFKTSNAEAGLRAFERDKADLLELGVPIRYITPEEDDSLEDGGYIIDLKRFRMPEVRLTPEEISALVLAASVARAMPGGAYPKIVDLALKKLAFDLPELPDTPTEFPRQVRGKGQSAVNVGPDGMRSTVLVHFPNKQAAVGRSSEELGDVFAQLEAATRFRKRLTITYQTAATGAVSQRSVDPYALAYRDGSWLLVGWCHLRTEIRSFRVDRILQCVMGPKPKSPDFDRPAAFDVRTYVQRSPWTFTTDPAETVQLQMSSDAADIANEDFGSGAVRNIDGANTLVTFECGNFDFAVSKILAAKGAISVLRGDRLRRQLQAELLAISERYR
jgi:predicted DNA-binding transcriptional regulator YafY